MLTRSILSMRPFDRVTEKKAHTVRLFFAAACLLVAAPSYAASSNLSLATSLQYYDSREYGDIGERLNREVGWLPGIGVRWQKDTDSLVRAGLYGEYSYGRVDYDGQTQTGTPFESDTYVRLFRLGGDISVCLQDCGASLDAGLAVYGRDRDIQGHSGVSSLYEEYRWLEWKMGGRWHTGVRKQVTLGAQWFRVIDAEMMIDFRPFGGGEPVVPLPDSNGYRLSLSYRFAERPLSLSLSHEWLDIDASDTILTTLGFGPVLVYEPESRAKHLKLALEWHL